MKIQNLLKFGLLLLITTWLGGCGASNLAGTYSPNAEQSHSYEKFVFTADGQFHFEFDGIAGEQGTYRIANNQVVLTLKQWSRNLDIRKDGCLVGGESDIQGVYCKQKS